MLVGAAAGCCRVKGQDVLLADALSLCLALLERVLVLELGAHLVGVCGVCDVFSRLRGWCCRLWRVC